MSINLNEQARQEMLKVLEKMKQEREKENCHQYKTLSDTLLRVFNLDREFIEYYNKMAYYLDYIDEKLVTLEKIDTAKRVKELFLTKTNNFYIEFFQDVECEIKKLIETLNKTLDKSDYKSHHNWTIAYEKLNTIYHKIFDAIYYVDKC